MISKLIENFKNIKIAVIGDLMLDEYIMGKVDRINKYYEILVDGDERFSYYTNLEDGSTIIITYFIEEVEDAAKFLNVSIKEEHMALFDYISSIETKRAYLHKFYDSEEEEYLYFVIRKKPKIKNYYITGILKTRKDYQGKSLNKIIKRIIGCNIR